MVKNIDNPKAFACNYGRNQGPHKNQDGMTLLDYFASKAINLFELDEDNIKAIKKGAKPNHSLVAGVCYDLAEAMLKERMKRLSERGES